MNMESDFIKNIIENAKQFDKYHKWKQDLLMADFEHNRLHDNEYYECMGYMSGDN